jgi:ribonuclease E
MSKEMLINASEPGNIRVAILESGRLSAYFEEYAEESQSRGNIYLGRITNVEPSLDACFVEYGEAKHGFLPLDEILPNAWNRKPAEGGSQGQKARRGQHLVVQVDKEPVGTKGARLTTNISLAGRYMVLMPYSETVGVSRKIEDPEQRQAYRDIAGLLEPPKGMGIIVRTAGLGQGKRDLSRDLSYLLRLWKEILTQAAATSQPGLLHAEAELILRVLRDYYTNDIDRTWIDEPEAFDRAQSFFKLAMPRQQSTLQAYQESQPIFSRFGVEQQLEQLQGRSVPLPSGGSLVIDSTEALVAIDVNSGKTKTRGGQEETAYETNLEAARELARQLRLRDLGGIVVIDFIDMASAAKRTAVDKALRDAMKSDKARHQLGKISSFGLGVLTRQRLGRALARTGSRVCPVCDGTGRVRDLESLALRVLRRIRAEAAGGRLVLVRVRLHPALCDHLQNRHRVDLLAIERQLGVQVEVLSSPTASWGQEELERVGREGGPPPAPRPLPPPPPPPKMDSPEPAVRTRPPEQEPARPTNEPVAGPAQGPAKDVDPTSSDEASRSKRRRRRRKKRPEGPAPEVGPRPEPAEAAAPGPVPVPDGAPGESDGENGERKKRRRRRRRRKPSGPAEAEGKVKSD